MSNTPIRKREALIVQPTVDWNGQDVAAFRDFLTRNPKFLLYLATQVPEIDLTNTKRAALSGARHAGFEALFKTLAGMVEETAPTERSPYIDGDPETQP